MSATHQAILDALCRRAAYDPSTILARLPGPDGEPVTVARMAGALASGEPWAREWAEDVTGAAVRMVVGRGPSERVDLDTWRAEAGACAPLDAVATKAPWRSTWGDDEGADAERGKRGEEVTIEAVGLEGLARIVLGVTWYDGPHPCCREEDAAFIEAARDGWPRDAARVGVLCAEVERLRAALAVAERAASLCAGEVATLRAECARLGVEACDAKWSLTP